MTSAAATNAHNRARRNNPSIAGADDGYDYGFHAAMDKHYSGKTRELHESADPRWVKNRAYRRAFNKAAHEGHKDGRETIRLSE